MNEITIIITNIIDSFGYFGIFFLMTLESTVIPLPSELILIPAGYLCFASKMNPIFVAIASTVGSLCGACFNYAMSYHFGRKFLLKYGRLFFLREDKFLKIEKFFLQYGNVSTFFGRLLPVVRHFISIPAGIYKINFKQFCIFTTLGALLWSVILIAFGYFVGKNIEMFKSYSHYLNTSILVLTAAFIGYKFFKK